MFYCDVCGAVEWERCHVYRSRRRRRLLILAALVVLWTVVLV